MIVLQCDCGFVTISDPVLHLGIRASKWLSDIVSHIHACVYFPFTPSVINKDFKVTAVNATSPKIHIIKCYKVSEKTADILLNIFRSLLQNITVYLC